MKRNALGRGISALMPETQGTARNKGSLGTQADDATPPIQQDLLQIPLERLTDNPFQPRAAMDEQSLAELTESIRARGVLQPILVRQPQPHAPDNYTVIAGHRRVEAARKAGLKHVPARMVQAETKELLELALIENLQRDALNPIEEALGYQSLMEEMDYTQEEVAKRVGKGRSTITNALRLLALPEPIKEALVENLIDAGHARALLAMADPNRQIHALDQILQKGLTVRDVENLARQQRPSSPGRHPSKSKAPTAVDPHLRELEKRLQSRMGTKVSIFPAKSGKGRIEIEYYTNSDLERILAAAGVRLDDDSL